ncbi:DUF1569 domain-containing protein [Ferruginibacter lapsinanis]|uniref:DUF1569 domain-containing protein n=1 Tax=Ferruginibacter lapsinanis TaxID=563172 RepID=UPI001E3EBE88|nr:DUF1569 domain-containing protein [Ferruginibacter lapsinanis]UEG50734.1 DUF1569 domain-containing protein [Ferruginibacter lapsinanis]
MKNLFDAETYNGIIDRINKLTPQTQRKWGKMDVAQMLAHCIEAFKVPVSEKELPRMFIGRLIGWMMKSKLYDESPWKRNLPTAPDFIIKNKRDFDIEKKDLLSIMEIFYKKNAAGIGDRVHPFFGKFTAEQWGKSMYKHLNHHLEQFGV